mmetsp:Transcript_27847/g.51988  ORF Transcript_27847/g.51988 Transcript_27847/m.51988 type:complete len:221 (+) Transcript_27847:2067-2729(+)
MLVAEFQLTLRCHHAKALHAADFAHGNGDIEPRNIHARFTDNDGDAFACVWRAADDLQLTLVGGHFAYTQFVGIRVLFGVHHFAQREVGQPLGRVGNVLNLKAKVGQRLDNLVNACVGLKVVFQPGKSEFHSEFLFACSKASSGINALPVKPRNAQKIIGSNRRAGSAGPEMQSHNGAASAGRCQKRRADPGCRTSASPSDRYPCQKQNLGIRPGQSLQL